jgi:hypothetical protein
MLEKLRIESQCWKESLQEKKNGHLRCRTRKNTWTLDAIYGKKFGHNYVDDQKLPKVKK